MEKNDKKQPVFTINCMDIVEECDITPMNLNRTYYIQDEAIADAKKYVEDMADDERVIEAMVYAVEYEDTETGDVFGEPYDIFTATNQNDPKKHAETRTAMHYVRETVDYYAQSGVKRLNEECEKLFLDFAQNEKEAGEDYFAVKEQLVKRFREFYYSKHNILLSLDKMAILRMLRMNLSLRAVDFHNFGLLIDIEELL